MTNENPTAPALSADFAVRVLEEADRVLARRLRVWRACATGTATVALVFAAALGLRALDRGAAIPPSAIFIADAQPLAPDAVHQDALDDLFPDAAPVERFDRTYLSGGSSADDLLADDASADDDGGL